MKAVILAGGLGTRISEETHLKPKPMVEVGGRPILWHIMKTFAAHGVTDFIICCGYKGYVIKEFFANYFLHTSDVTFDLATNSMTVIRASSEPWKVTLIDTGAHTNTGGRLRRIKPYLENEEDFCFTYGDGLSDVDISSLIAFHKRHKKLATITAVSPPGRFGALDIRRGKVEEFKEKPRGDGAKINGGYFVLKPQVIDYIKDDETAWEEAPLISLADNDELMAFEHNGFWQPMDTLREKMLLQKLWDDGTAPWKKW
jgi:glucose-1-phosphate cytidylyltransferase